MLRSLHVLAFSLTLLVIGTQALPATTAEPWPQAILDRCSQSVNCKVVNGQPQVDLGKAKRLLAKRQDSVPNSNITYIVPNQGTVNTYTCKPSDLVKSALNDHCLDRGGCSTDASETTCEKPADTVKQKVTTQCTVTQEGQYGDSIDDSFKGMITTALTAAAQSFTTSQDQQIMVHWWKRELDGREIMTPPPTEKIKFTTYQAPTSISASNWRYIDEKNNTVAVGMVRYSLQCGPPDDTACSTILNAGTAISGLLSLLAPEVIGPLFAAGLGILTPLC
ncbi:hypothetical protein K474DRAFT_1672551 [Panus rudis PR-1116 ss-1]|nr:hypothetical protein K474DRAFT_1672551 [Panus rudis PR-1116 ss-1]